MQQHLRIRNLDTPKPKTLHKLLSPKTTNLADQLTLLLSQSDQKPLGRQKAAFLRVITQK